MLYSFKKCKNTTETQKRLVQSVWRRCCDWTCQKWFVKFHAGNFPLATAPCSGRPAEVESDQIETWIENNQCFTTREIADILKISKSIHYWWKWKMCLIFCREILMDFVQPNMCIYNIYILNNNVVHLRLIQSYMLIISQ